jgi:hypothetical protein
LDHRQDQSYLLGLLVVQFPNWPNNPFPDLLTFPVGFGQRVGFVAFPLIAGGTVAQMHDGHHAFLRLYYQTKIDFSNLSYSASRVNCNPSVKPFLRLHTANRTWKPSINGHLAKIFPEYGIQDTDNCPMDSGSESLWKKMVGKSASGGEN